MSIVFRHLLGHIKRLLALLAGVIQNCLMPEYLFQNNGKPFPSSHVEEKRRDLDFDDDDARVQFRNDNADAIKNLDSTRLLIVSGPGTGKSTLFAKKIQKWLDDNPGKKVRVLSFVKKLVKDLDADLQRLGEDYAERYKVSTLHGLARSIVEGVHGTSEWPYRPNIKVINDYWAEQAIWPDVLHFHESLNANTHSWGDFKKQMYENIFEETVEWIGLKQTYYKLCQFYNGAGFADLILRAATILAENRGTRNYSFFLIDEFQDFNNSEDYLIQNLTLDSDATVLVGDDDQVLYDELKSGKASIIRRYYADTSYVNAMLPYCGRCDYHITKVADTFINSGRTEQSISKVFLPLKKADAGKKVQMLLTTKPGSTIKFINNFLEEHSEEIKQRTADIAERKSKDPYLLILSPDSKVGYFQNDAEHLKNMVDQYRPEKSGLSSDYYLASSYFVLGADFTDNFGFRKVLHYEGNDPSETHSTLSKALDTGTSLSEVDDKKVKAAMTKCLKIREVLQSGSTPADMVEQLDLLISIKDKERLTKEIEEHPISDFGKQEIGLEDEREVEGEEEKASPVELMPIVGSKGLSADHVIILGFDNKNMGYVTKQAFYVAITRARKSLSIVTTLRARGASEVNGFFNLLPEEHLDFASFRLSDSQPQVLTDRAAFLSKVSSWTYHSRNR